MLNISEEPLYKVDAVTALLEARMQDPFGFLGRHQLSDGRWVVRSFQPQAAEVWVTAGEGNIRVKAEKIHEQGLFVAILGKEFLKQQNGLNIKWKAGGESHYTDPYQFGLLLGEQDMYYFCEGKHESLYEMLGAHEIEIEGVKGVRFSVWAPNARRVSVVGDFNDWDGRVNPMRLRIEAGVWELFLPQARVGTHYKFELLGADSGLHVKSDPFAFFGQNGIETSSLVFDRNSYHWQDADWMNKRQKIDSYHQAMSIYEVHLGSWKKVIEDGNRSKTYVELADDLVNYVKSLGFTHVELMPVSEYPFEGSWGYQVTGYYAPTSRYGNPNDFKYLVDRFHQAGIGVILDWVPGHFPKDAHGLAKFDGTALYEHSDPRQGEHQDWGTLIFNYGRNEVRNFLVANALYWLEYYHIDGLRVDAVASMLYLDYSRKPWAWVPNSNGGRENLEAIAFMKECNEHCYRKFPGITMIAEESTAWGGVSKPTHLNGLGYGYKWNMGWMNDSLRYMQQDPVYRKYSHQDATFSMIYAFDENFILVLSHDEVVHGKGSLINKMPGDRWQKFANLRMFYAWMWSHPGKKLLFMGCEFAQWEEWKESKSLDWHLFLGAEHAGMQRLIGKLNELYLGKKALSELDHEPGGFEWIEGNDAENSIFVYERKGKAGQSVYVIVNATPVERRGYRVGVNELGQYHVMLNTDALEFGGAGLLQHGHLRAEKQNWQGRNQSLLVDIPALATVWLEKM